MTTYIALFSLTEAGIGAARIRRVGSTLPELLADMGCEMKQFYMVFGEFDFVQYCDARRGALRPAASHRRLRAHEDAEGFPGDRLPRNCPLARLKPRRFQTALPGPRGFLLARLSNAGPGGSPNRRARGRRPNASSEADGVDVKQVHSG